LRRIPHPTSLIETAMPASNAELAAALARTADLLELTAANPFRVRAYRSAARRIESLGESIAEAVAAEKDLATLPDIGKDLAGALVELVNTGRFTLIDELEAAIPPGLPALLEVEGLGPKRTRRLWQELGIVDAQTLRDAATAGRIRALDGFGAKSEANLLRGLDELSRRSGRMLLADAMPLAEQLRRDLAAVPGVRCVEIAGSLRRGKETVGDLDFLVTADDPAAVLDAFCAHPSADRTIGRGDSKASVLLTRGIQADLRAVPASSLGAALHYFTGSKEHNVAMRRRAQARGWRLNEYALAVESDGRVVAGDTEDSIFSSLGLSFIPPELREDRGELALAERDALPQLISAADIRGNLHAHSDWSDGTRTIREMADEARRRGYAYLAITDHSFGLAVAGGLDADRLIRQIDEIAALNEELDDLVLLAGIECDITTDGELELPNDVLRRLDVVIGAIHRNFRLPREQQTRRMLRALENPWLTFLAHPTGRLLTRREGYDIDLDAVLRAAAERGVMIEINANPWRLDLDDVHARRAHELGIRIPVNTDAHSFADFDNIRWGVMQARRAGLTAADVPNTQPLAELRRQLAATRIA
jgi:DNA polymerase (family 10)